MGKDNKKKTSEKKEEASMDIVTENLEGLVIDPVREWSFKSEDELYDFFKKDIQKLEKEFKSYIDASTDSKQQTLEFTLEDPDEVWERTDFFEEDRPLHIFIKNFGKTVEIALCHLFELEPVFIYSHFTVPVDTDISSLKFEFLVRDNKMKEVFKGALDGDSLHEGDKLAIGLYKAMMTLRSEEDFQEEEFAEFLEIREQTIEEADEIWRSMDSYGNYLVHFVKEYQMANTVDTEEVFHYVATTVEDEASDSNVLLFSFPTMDKSLLDRYRIGENMQAEEVVQEESH